VALHVHGSNEYVGSHFFLFLRHRYVSLCVVMVYVCLVGRLSWGSTYHLLGSVIWGGPGGLRASPSAAREARTKAGKSTVECVLVVELLSGRGTTPSERPLRGKGCHIPDSCSGYMLVLF